LDAAHLVDHFYVDFVEYLVVGLENGTKTLVYVQ